MTDDELVMDRLMEDDDDIVFILHWTVNPEHVKRRHAMEYPHDVVVEYSRSGFLEILRPFKDQLGIYHYRKEV